MVTFNNVFKKPQVVINSQLNKSMSSALSKVYIKRVDRENPYSL